MAEGGLVPRALWDAQQNSLLDSVHDAMQGQICTVARLHTAMQNNRDVREGLENKVRPPSSMPCLGPSFGISLDYIAPYLN